MTKESDYLEYLDDRQQDQENAMNEANKSLDNDDEENLFKDDD